MLKNLLFLVLIIFSVNVFANERLVAAARSNDIEGVERELKKGANVNYQTRDGNTALIWAAYNGNYKMASLLVEEYNANVNLYNRKGNTALIWATVGTSEHNKSVIGLLVRKGADADRLGEQGTALYSALENGQDLSIIKLIVEKARNGRATITKPGEPIFFHTPIHSAASSRNRETVEYLVNQSGNPNAVILLTKHNLTPLMSATASANLAVVEYLLDNPLVVREINRKSTNGATALTFAGGLLNNDYFEKKEDADQIAHLLIINKADVNIPDGLGNTILIYAAMCDNDFLAEISISKGAKTDYRNKQGKTALDIAKEKRYPKIIALLEPKSGNENIAKEDPSLKEKQPKAWEEQTRERVAADRKLAEQQRAEEADRLVQERRKASEERRAAEAERRRQQADAEYDRAARETRQRVSGMPSDFSTTEE